LRIDKARSALKHATTNGLINASGAAGDHDIRVVPRDEARRVPDGLCAGGHAVVAHAMGPRAPVRIETQPAAMFGKKPGMAYGFSPVSAPGVARRSLQTQRQASQGGADRDAIRASPWTASAWHPRVPAGLRECEVDERVGADDIALANTSRDRIR